MNKRINLIGKRLSLTIKFILAVIWAFITTILSIMFTPLVLCIWIFTGNWTIYSWSSKSIDKIMEIIV